MQNISAYRAERDGFMTMAVGFILGDYVYLASDKRTTQLNNDGTDKAYTDGGCKIFPLPYKTLVFSGGIVQATQPLKIRIMREFAGKELNERDFEKIGELCQEAYENFMQRVSDELKASLWLKDFVLSVIIADNTDKPRIIRYDIEDNFKPIVQANQGSIVVKSAIEPSILWPEIQEIAKEEGKGKFNPIAFIGKIFLRAAEMNKAISAAHDLFVIPPSTINSLAFQKIQAGTITASITIQSPVINGATINGGTINVQTDAVVGSALHLYKDSNPYVVFKNMSVTGGQTSLTIGKAVSVGAGIANLDRVDLLAGTLYVYNNIYAASSISIAGNAVATQPWVNSNFAAQGHTHSQYALTTHDHGNLYIHSAVGQNLSCQVYGGYLEVFQNGSYAGRVQLTA